MRRTPRAAREDPDAGAGAINVDPLISARVPLDEAGRIYQALDRGEIVGRALVVP